MKPAIIKKPTVTREKAAQLLYSGKYDHLTAKQFREMFPLKS